ncbi:Chromatin structure-remodeling complex subunit RSC7 [Termitomyces sp. J132]|nr:Chromatin structure-remodeling complex subunit RSC7 [Termitomyces sp. J132]
MPQPAPPPVPTVTIPGTSSRLIAPPQPLPLPENDEDGDEDAMDVDSVADAPTGDEGSGSRVGTPRPRGRPRGRGKSATAVSGTPRARGRGRGRGRPRGKGGLTIRLPKRGDEEGDEEIVKEEPLGGGKPFRKIQGKVYIIDGDEFVTDEDPKGNEKIDHSGVLLGDRKFKAATFILPNRHPTRHYMLAIDAARTSGFRDSLYYFRRNPLAFKLNATQPEKDYLITQGKLGSHLRTRSVTLITARSAFKLHGSKMVVDGKWVIDDYYEEKVTEEIAALGLKPGDPVGELPDPNATSHNEVTSLAVASTGATAGKGDRVGGGIYRAGGPTTIFGSSGWGPYSDGPLNAVRKSLLSRDGVDEENWMFMMAQRVLEAGQEWAKWRKEEEGEEEEDGAHAEDRTASKAKGSAKRRRVSVVAGEPPLGIYEPHTGLVIYREDTQPTQSRWELLPDSGEKRAVLGGTKTGNGAWALAWVDTIMKLENPQAIESRISAEKKRLVQESLGDDTKLPIIDLT